MRKISKSIVAVILVLWMMPRSSLVAEELRSISYELTEYSIERNFIQDERDGDSVQLPATRVIVYEDLDRTKMRLILNFHPAFDEYREAKVTYVEKPHPDSCYFVLNAPIALADQYLALLNARKAKRVDGTYDKSQPQGSSTITFATTKFGFLLESR